MFSMIGDNGNNKIGATDSFTFKHADSFMLRKLPTASEWEKDFQTRLHVYVYMVFCSHNLLLPHMTDTHQTPLTFKLAKCQSLPASHFIKKKMHFSTHSSFPFPNLFHRKLKCEKNLSFWIEIKRWKETTLHKVI